MIVQEIDIVKENKQKAEELKEILKALELPKKCFMAVDVKPYHNVYIMERSWYEDKEIATLSLGKDNIINIVIDKENVSKLKEYLINSKLKFKLTIDDEDYF